MAASAQKGFVIDIILIQMDGLGWTPEPIGISGQLSAMHTSCLAAGMAWQACGISGYLKRDKSRLSWWMQ